MDRLPLTTTSSPLVTHDRAEWQWTQAAPSPRPLSIPCVTDEGIATTTWVAGGWWDPGAVPPTTLRRLRNWAHKDWLSTRRSARPRWLWYCRPSEALSQRAHGAPQPRHDEIVHHLLTVEAALAILRSAGTDMVFSRFWWDEPLRQASRAGRNFARLAGQDVEALPDGRLDLVGPNGPRSIPIEVITSKYTDATILRKKRLLPDNTLWFADTMELVDRTTALIGTMPFRFPADQPDAPDADSQDAPHERPHRFREAVARSLV